MGNQPDEEGKITKLSSNKAMFTDDMLFRSYISHCHGYSRPPSLQPPTEFSDEGLLSIEMEASERNRTDGPDEFDDGFRSPDVIWTKRRL